MLKSLSSCKFGYFGSESFGVSLHNFIFGHLDQISTTFVVTAFLASTVRTARLSTGEAFAVELETLRFWASAFFNFFFVRVARLLDERGDGGWLSLGWDRLFWLDQLVKESLLFFFWFYNSFVSAVAGGNLLFFDLNGFFLTALYFPSYCE